MYRKICPACGEKSLKKILYGYPSDGAFEEATKGKILLGGCIFELHSPDYKCISCEKEFLFFSSNKLPFYFKTFDFYLGGFSRPSYYVYVDGKKDEKIIKYAYSEYGLSLDIKNDNPCDFEDVYYKNIKLDEDTWENFVKDIGNTLIEFWNEEYIDMDILDGTQWHVKVDDNTKHSISRVGSNLYPPYWKKLLKVLNNYLDEIIK